MTVDSNHPDYDKYATSWKVARDAVAGQMAIHKAGEAYLPKLSDQEKSEYHAYKGRALFYEASGRTIEGLQGMLFRKEPVIEELGMADFLEDVDMQGLGLEGFAKDLAKEVLVTGRAGILVDFPAIDTGELSIAQAQAAGARPFLKTYTAESIFNWRENEVRLKEVIQQVDPEDEFATIYIDQIRVLDLDESNSYRVRVYHKLKDQKSGKVEWIMVDEIMPRVNGARLPFIPFVFVSVDDTKSDVVNPPMMGLFNVNISHYKNSADLEHGAHFTGLPTPVITGVSNEEAGEMRIGSTVAWMLSNPDASAEYLEFQGQGLSALTDLMANKEGKMASLGAQMLTPDSRRNEAAETAGIRHMGENSILSSIAYSLSEAINTSLEYASLWLGSQPATIAINTDFMPSPMTPQMLREMVTSWQSGAISYETLFSNLQAGEIIDAKKAIDEELSEIETNDVVFPDAT